MLKIASLVRIVVWVRVWVDSGGWVIGVWVGLGLDAADVDGDGEVAEEGLIEL